MQRRWLGAVVMLALLGGGIIAILRLLQPASTLRTFTAGAFPYALALSGSAHVFVLNRTSDWTGMSADGGGVSIVDMRTGTVVRRVPVGDDPRAIALDEPAGRVFVANDDDASVSVLDEQSGRTLCTIRVGAGPRAVAVDEAAQRVYVVSAGDDTLSVLDAHSGVLLHTVRLDAASASAGTKMGFGPGTGQGPVPAGGASGLRRVGGTSGSGATPFALPGFGSVAVAAVQGRVFVGSGGAITVLDARSGAVRRTILVGEAVQHLVADPRSGQVIIAGPRTVRLLETRQGWRLTPLLSGHPSALALDTQRGRVFVADLGPTDPSGQPTGQGSVSVLDVVHGTIRRTVTVGVAPLALAVEEGSGHVVVINAGGPVHVRRWWTWLPDWLVSRLPFLAGQGSNVQTVPGSVSIVRP